jgi:hypothetical protein
MLAVPRIVCRSHVWPPLGRKAKNYWGTKLLHKLAIVSLALLALCHCGQELQGTKPPQKSLYYPISIVTDATHAYVINGDNDQRFESGWISAVDLAVLIDPAKEGREAIGQQLPIPPLGYKTAFDGKQILVPFRGLASVGLINAQAGTLECVSADGTKKDACETSDLLTFDADKMKVDSDLVINDPFTVAFIPPQADQPYYAAAGFLGSSKLAIFTVPDLVFKKSIALGDSGIVSLATYPDPAKQFLLASSQLLSTSSVLTTQLYNVDISLALQDAPRAVTTQQLGAQLGGIDSSDTLISPDGNTTFVSERFANGGPGSISLVDTSIITESFSQTDTLMRPALRPLSAITLPSRPQAMLYVARQGAEDLLFVASFTENAIYVVSVKNRHVALRARLSDVGDGPEALGHVRFADRELLLVTTFFDHSLIAFDITAPSPSGFYEIKRVRNESLPLAARH